MSPKKLLVTAAAIAVAAGAAILIPGVASGVPLALVPVSSVVAPHAPSGDDDSGSPGGGKAWGHHKDDPGFPGDKGEGRAKDKHSPGSDDSDSGGGKAWGHHKDDPGFPGNDGQGHGRDKTAPDD